MLRVYKFPGVLNQALSSSPKSLKMAGLLLSFFFLLFIFFLKLQLLEHINCTKYRFFVTFHTCIWYTLSFNNLYSISSLNTINKAFQILVQKNSRFIPSPPKGMLSTTSYLDSWCIPVSRLTWVCTDIFPCRTTSPHPFPCLNSVLSRKYKPNLALA